MADDFSDRFVDDVFALDAFIHCSLDGIGYATIAGEVTEKIRSFPQSGDTGHPLSDDRFYESRKKHIKKLEAFAAREIESGNSYLFSLACIKLWSILEAATDHMLSLLMCDKERVGKSKVLKRVKVPLTLFLQISDEQQRLYMRESLIRELGASLKVGVGQFEASLNELGLGGTVSPFARKSLLELNEVRNLVVHRASIADKRFVDRCPWFSLSIGQKVLVTSFDFDTYSKATLWYLFEIEQRYKESTCTVDDKSVEAAKLLEDLEKWLGIDWGNRVKRNRPIESE